MPAASASTHTVSPGPAAKKNASDGLEMPSAGIDGFVMIPRIRPVGSRTYSLALSVPAVLFQSRQSFTTHVLPAGTVPSNSAVLPTVTARQSTPDLTVTLRPPLRRPFPARHALRAN